MTVIKEPEVVAFLEAANLQNGDFIIVVKI